MTLTAKELYQRFVGRKGLLRVLDYPESDAIGIEVPVEILDARISYGNEHLLVSPHRGVGSVFVDARRVRVVPDWPDEKGDDHDSTDGIGQGDPVAVG